jgi:hypothetical protein
MIDRLGHAGLVGARARIGAWAADHVARRTRLDASTLRNLVGLYLLLSGIRRIAQMARRLARGA